MKSSDFSKEEHTIVFVFLWWIIWLLIHNTKYTNVINAKVEIQALFLLMNIMVLVGYYSVKFILQKEYKRVDWIIECNPKMEKMVTVFLVLIFMILVLAASKSGAFTNTYAEYFLKIRGSAPDSLGSRITGISQIDQGLKLFVYPILLALFFVGRVVEYNKKILFFCTVVLLLMFSYLYQVSYPIIAIIIIYIISAIYKYKMIRPASNNTKLPSVVLLIILVLWLFFAVSKRYGDLNIPGIIQYYLVNYFTLGFYLFQKKIENISFSGMGFTLGRSLLGPIELYIYKVLEFLGCPNLFYPEYLVNTLYNSGEVAAFSSGGKANAFATIAFTFYRDLGIPGVVLGAFFLGGLISYVRLKSDRLIPRFLYLYLLFIYAIGIMVSPFEQPYVYLTPAFGVLMLKKIKL